MKDRFEGRIVLVAGGTGGLGRAVSIRLLEEGATVVVTFRRHEELDSLRSATGGNASRLEGREADVTDEVKVRELVDSIVARWGRLDAVVNTVGGFVGGSTLWEADANDMHRMLELNVHSAWALSRVAVPAMLAHGGGAIVNVSATAAVDHPAGLGAYSASKAAAVALIGSLASDLRGTEVRANSVLPSIIDTVANRRSMPDADYTKWPKPAEIAAVILFLVSEDAKLVNGATIRL